MPSPTGQPGFQATDLGKLHVPPGSSIEYAYCPPTSGTHYFAAAQVPIQRGFYGPESMVRPGSWVHNLEHGYIVVAYRGGTEGAATPDEIAQLQTFLDTAPASDFPESGLSLPNKLVVLRFDAMATRFAVLAWDRALLIDEWDADRALTFYEQWVDSPQAPEPGL